MPTTLEYKCPCCGGKIEFDSTLQKLKCPFCDTEYDVSTLRDYDDALKQEAPPEEMHWQKRVGAQWSEADEAQVFVCKSCGGELVTDANTAATSCPFCGNPVILAGRLSGDLMPDYVIPFQLDKKAAIAAMKKHFMKKKLLPKRFKEDSHLEEVKGIYVPFWLFDADANADIRYRATRKRVWSDSNYTYTETRHFSLLRAGSIGFNHVPVDCSTKMPDDLMESIEPFDHSRAVDFQTAYLAGYFADRYDVTAEQSESRANARIRTSTEQAFAATAQGYSTVVPERTSIRLSDSRASYALYPVWLLQTTWNGASYLFAMNGQTGKFVGNLPMDKGAYWRWWAIWTGILAAGIYAIFWILKLLNIL